MGHWHRKHGIKTAMSLIPKGFLAEQLEEENNNPLNGHLTRTTRVFLNSLHQNQSVTLTLHIHLIILISAAELSTCSLSSLAMFHCHVTYNYAHNFYIISLS